MYFTVVAQITPLCNRPSGIFIFSGFSEKKSLGWFIFHWVFHLSCVFPIKAGRGGRPYMFTGMKTLNTLYKQFTVFYARLTTCTLPILFLSRDLSEISWGEGGAGVETEGGSQLFETQKREGS